MVLRIVGAVAVLFALWPAAPAFADCQLGRAFGSGANHPIPEPGEIAHSTLLGGECDEEGFGVAQDAAGNVYVAGAVSSSLTFPVTPGAYDQTFNGGAWDAFVAKFNPTLSSLLYATYVGGAGTDRALRLSVDAQGNAFVAGETTSETFPTTPGAFDQTWNGGIDGWVAKLDPSGSTLQYGTFLGGSGADRILGFALGEAGEMYASGETGSAGFP